MERCPNCGEKLLKQTQDMGENRDSGGVGTRHLYRCESCHYRASCLTVDKFRAPEEEHWQLLHWPPSKTQACQECSYVQATPEHRLCHRCGRFAKS